MRVLVACEFSGTVRDAFAALGHDAWSRDVLPTERPGQHYQRDVRDVLGLGWDLMVGHPPCTYLSRAGARWWGAPEREAKSQEALRFVLALWAAPIDRVALENPVGRLWSWWRKPDQIIEPWQFGDPFSKRTCLWLRGLPPLMSTVIETRYRAFLPSNTGGAKRGQRTQPGVVSGGRNASRTFHGIALAMAEQWGGLAQEDIA